jgi:methionyl aminopeptidase
MIKNNYERKLIKRSGEIAAKALKRALESAKAGASGIEIDNVVQREIYKQGGDLSYKTVPDYKWASCITVNEGVVHGIPTDRKLVMGDLVSVDLAVMYKGWHTDCAWSCLLGNDSEKQKFLKAGEGALWDGIEKAVAGGRVGDISSAIQKRIEEAGYQVVRSLVGHGVGRKLHEEPEIPCYGEKNTGMVLKSGMTLAIEVIYTQGSSDLVLADDGWTYRTADRSWGGLFEMTVLVGKDKGEVLTDWHKV